MTADPQQGATTAPTVLTVAIVEDNAHFRERFASIVEAAPTLSLAGTARDLASALSLAGRLSADVWLVDLGLPDGSGIDVIRHLARHQPEADVMVVTVFGDDHHVVASLEAGATGYLLKEAMPMELVECILALRAGGSPISPVIARRLLGRFVGGPPGAGTGTVVSIESPLTARETEILQLVAKGLGFAEIGDVMSISPHTVTAHVKNIYRKLAVHSRGEAVYEARQMGLLRS